MKKTNMKLERFVENDRLFDLWVEANNKKLSVEDFNRISGFDFWEIYKKRKKEIRSAIARYLLKRREQNKILGIGSRGPSKGFRMEQKPCGFSNFGRNQLRPRHPDREGFVVGYSLHGYPRVRWNGIKAVYSYHPDFIEIKTP
jgi:hypothetical protein